MFLFNRKLLSECQDVAPGNELIVENEGCSCFPANFDAAEFWGRKTNKAVTDCCYLYMVVMTYV